MPAHSPADLDLNDAHWMPLSFDSQNDTFMFAWVDISHLQAAFLDQRIGEPWLRRFPVPANAVPNYESATAPAWLFHTAFCCSTLLARALHAPPVSVALKEPNILLDLTRMSLTPDASTSTRVGQRIKEATVLLRRPWAEDGHVLIKPTNVANRLLPRLLTVTPSSPALLLYGSLEDFLMSCAKKLPGAEKPLQWMAQYLLPGTALEQKLGVLPGRSLNFVESCVLIWHAQMEIYSNALASDATDRLRSLNMSALLARPEEAVEASAIWLGLDQAEARSSRMERVRKVFATNSKQLDIRYGPDRRAMERERIMERFGDLIHAAMDWSEQCVRPYARLPVDWKPLMPT